MLQRAINNTNLNQKDNFKQTMAWKKKEKNKKSTLYKYS